LNYLIIIIIIIIILGKAEALAAEARAAKAHTEERLLMAHQMNEQEEGTDDAKEKGC
jgi:hypothetical protein